MRFGATGFDADFFMFLKKFGYDYAELSFSRIVPLTDEEFEQKKKELDAAGLKAEVCNGFFPGDFVLYAYNSETGQEDVEGFKQIEENVRTYIKRGFERVSLLGCDTVVIGSGGARTIREDMSPEVARKQFSRVLEICADTAKDYGITVTVEPLNPKEVNFINTLSDSLDIVEALNHPNAKAMVDFFHEGMQCDPTISLERAGNKLVHTHIARVEDRLYCTVDDVEYFTPVFESLKKIGYDARMSFEGGCRGDYETGLSEMKKFIDHFKALGY